MARPALTRAEKIAKGTHQPCLDKQPRPVAEVTEDLEDLRLAADAARAYLRAHKDDFKAIADALTKKRSIMREIALLEEELSLANEKEKTTDEFAEFD